MPDQSYKMAPRSRKQIAVVAAGIFVLNYNTVVKKKERSKWVKKWLSEKNIFGHMKLIKELRTNEPDDFKNYLRMSETDFDLLLLGLLKPYLSKTDSIMRQCIPPEERLIATLRFLATGRSYEDLKFSTGIAAQTLGYIIPETCEIIFQVLKEKYMKVPATKEEWNKVAKGFKDRWEIINCGGCLDVKHIRITQPSNSGALYYNYKKFYSIVVMVLVNADYEFLYVDVGKQGTISDGGVFEATTFNTKLQNGTLNLPNYSENEEELNSVFVGDEAFALTKHILRPYSQRELTYERRVYNYRIARARNIMENAFGLITSRFRVLHTSINIQPHKINHIVMAICVLHNFLTRKSTGYDNSLTFDNVNPVTHEVQPGNWRKNLNRNVDEIITPFQVTSQTNSTLDGKTNRQKYLNFFNGKGRVSWQDDMIRKGKA